MSTPEQRTALREAVKRDTSPSSDRIVVAVSGPIPYWRISAWQPGLVSRQAREFTLDGDRMAVDLVDVARGPESLGDAARSVSSSNPWARAGVRLVSSGGVALRHAREGDEQDIRGRARVEHVIHFAWSLDERLPRTVGRGLALAANR